MTEEKQKSVATILSQKSEVQGNVRFGKEFIRGVKLTQKVVLFTLIAQFQLKEVTQFLEITILLKQMQNNSMIFVIYLQERVSIVNKKSKDPSKNKNMVIGSFNLFEVGSKIDSSDIGNMNHFEPRTQFKLILNLKTGSVEQDCQIKDKCTIGACVKLPQGTIIEDKKIYYPDKVVKELNFDEARFQKHIVSMYSALSILIPQNNPVKQI